LAFRNFIYVENEEDLSFLPKKPSPGFDTGSPFVSLEVFVVHLGSVAARIKERRCRTRGGSSRPPVNRKLAPGSSSSRATRAHTSFSKDDTPFLTVFEEDEDANDCHLKISAIIPPAWKNHLDNHMDVELLDLAGIVECSGEWWEWRETEGLGFTGVGGKSVVQWNSILKVETAP
nr:hypothetical protein [Tanacetum cinerariifolium]